MSTYVATDLHGMYNLWEGIRDYLKEDDKLIYLGDAIDRGPRGWELMVELFNDPRVIYLKGNHEELMYWAFKAPDEYIKTYEENWVNINGGDKTLYQIKELGISNEELEYYLKRIRNLPTYYTYLNDNGNIFHLSHAGMNPDDFYYDLDIGDQNHSHLWDRRHIFREWPEDGSYDDYYVIHGHTPIQLLHKADTFIDGIQKDVPFVYANGHKIDLDVSSINTNMAILYNLDTEQEVFIKGV